MNLSWDWGWEWVPADATTVTVAVRSFLKGELKTASSSRGGETSVTWENLVTGQEDDRLLLTLTFDSPSRGDVAKTNVLYVLKGAFGAAEVRAVEINSQPWRNYRYPLVFSYDAAWYEGAEGEASLKLTERQPGAAASVFALEGARGVAFLGVNKGDLPHANWSASLSFGGERAADVELDFAKKGVLIIFR